MANKFLTRGYQRRIVDGFKEKASQTDRGCLLSGSRRPTGDNRILLEHTTEEMPFIEAFKEPPLMSYRGAVSLRDKLVKADIGSTKPKNVFYFGELKKGNFPCQGCSCCNNMVWGYTFTHPHTGRVFQVKQRYTCSSKFVIYMINCPCGLIYVGETTMEIRKRISKHKSTIRTGLLDLLNPRHFAMPRRGRDRQALLRERELMWIHKLDCLFPRGLNLEFKLHNLT